LERKCRSKPARKRFERKPWNEIMTDQLLARNLSQICSSSSHDPGVFCFSLICWSVRRRLIQYQWQWHPKFSHLIWVMNDQWVSAMCFHMFWYRAFHHQFLFLHETRLVIYYRWMTHKCVVHLAVRFNICPIDLPEIERPRNAWSLDFLISGPWLR
jgi:hypothetical protein